MPFHLAKTWFFTLTLVWLCGVCFCKSREMVCVRVKCAISLVFVLHFAYVWIHMLIYAVVVQIVLISLKKKNGRTICYCCCDYWWWWWYCCCNCCHTNNEPSFNQMPIYISNKIYYFYPTKSKIIDEILMWCRFARMYACALSYR